MCLTDLPCRIVLLSHKLIVSYCLTVSHSLIVCYRLTVSHRLIVCWLFLLSHSLIMSYSLTVSHSHIGAHSNWKKPYTYFGLRPTFYEDPKISDKKNASTGNVSIQRLIMLFQCSRDSRTPWSDVEQQITVLLYFFSFRYLLFLLISMRFRTENSNWALDCWNRKLLNCVSPNQQNISIV